MSDERIAPEILGVAADAVADCLEGDLREQSPATLAEVAIRAADRARGLKEEFSVVHEDGRRQETNKNSALALTFNPSGRRMESRLTSDWADWRPVERPS